MQTMSAGTLNNSAGNNRGAPSTCSEPPPGGILPSGTLAAHNTRRRPRPSRDGSDSDFLLDMLLVDDSPTDIALFVMAVHEARLSIRTRPMEAVDRAIRYLRGEGLYGERARFPLPSLVVVDWNMPGKGGADFLKWKATAGALAKLPVVVLSGSLDPRTAQEALALGAVAYLPKPPLFGDWTATVRQIRDVSQDQGDAAKPPAAAGGQRKPTRSPQS